MKKNIVLGCVTVPLVLVLVAVGGFVLLKVMGPPDSKHRNQELEQPVAQTWVDDSGATVSDPAEPATAARELVVRIEFEEGEFEILPGRPGESIQVDAEYDEAVYELNPTFEKSSSTHENFELVFKKHSGWASLRQMVHGESSPNHVRVRLPPGVPMDLTVRMRKGELELDLTGLSVRNLRLDHAMGSTTLIVDEPNPVAMENLEIQAKMGEVTASGLGNASARVLVLNGRMGDFRLDLDGEWKNSVQASIRISMGEARLSVPHDTRIEMAGSRVLFGEFSRRHDSEQTDPETSGPPRILSVNAKVTFGSIDID